MVLFDLTMLNKAMSEADEPDFYSSGTQYLYGFALVIPAIYVFYMLVVA